MTSPHPSPPQADPRPRGDATARAYFLVEGLSSLGASLLMVGIFFYMTHRFGWGVARNLTLAATQGVIYVTGSLLAQAVSGRLGRRRALVVAYAAMAALAAAALAAPSATVLVGVLLAYTLAAATTWPALESLVSDGVEPAALSRRLGVYNLVWSTVGAAAVAVTGAVIEHWPAGMFLIPAAVHAAAAVVLWGEIRASLGGPSASPLPSPAAAEHARPSPARAAARVHDPHLTGGEAGGASNRPGAGDAAREGDSAGGGGGGGAVNVASHPHAAPEPELLRVRTLALWLSRLSLPATYVVIYSVMAMMPSLPLIRRLGPAEQTLVGAAWMLARSAGFVVLGRAAWWHTRPRLLLGAAVLMLVAFLAIVARPQWVNVSPDIATAPWVAWTLAWQVVLGLSLAMIYAASLYFGMVLSEGSTEHGGYHEALIGLGSVIGPGSGALAQYLANGSEIWGVAAVAGVLGTTVVVATIVSLRRRAVTPAEA